MAKKFASFCGRPECDCAVADEHPCDSYFPSEDSGGVIRCAHCGNLSIDHGESSRKHLGDAEYLRDLADRAIDGEAIIDASRLIDIADSLTTMRQRLEDLEDLVQGDSAEE